MMAQIPMKHFVKLAAVLLTTLLFCVLSASCAGEPVMDRDSIAIAESESCPESILHTNSVTRRETDESTPASKSWETNHVTSGENNIGILPLD